MMAEPILHKHISHGLAHVLAHVSGREKDLACPTLLVHPAVANPTMRFVRLSSTFHRVDSDHVDHSV